MFADAKTRLWLGIALGIFAALIFAGGAVVSRYLVTQGQTVADLTVVRYVGCFPLAALAILMFPSRLSLDISWRRLAILLLVGGPPYHALLITGYGHATSGAGALLVTGLVPVAGYLVGFVLGGQAPRWQAVAGGVLVLAGLVVFGGLATTATFSSTGLAIFVMAAFAWAVLNYCVKAWGVDPLRLTLALALWSPLFLPLYWLAEVDIAGLSPSWDLGLQLVYHGWLVAIAATLLFFASIRLAGTHIAAALLALVPPFAAVMGATLLGEPVTTTHVIGTLITVAGIALAAWFASTTSTRPTPAVAPNPLIDATSDPDVSARAEPLR